MKKNIYRHAIDLKKITVRNAPRQEFAERMRAMEYRGYEVEALSNEKKIVVTKPGGKRVYGRNAKEDFQVFIFTPTSGELWQITHDQIAQDIETKANECRDGAISLLNLLERVQNGKEPDDFIDEINALSFQTGETPETILKVYKWIWGQEDINYPKGKGRTMSWEGLVALREKLLA
jgi:hypothetical protein